jgi:DNA-binding transcriptional ArsR family regulator
VLLLIASNPRATLRELAAAIGITERSVSGIVADLEAAGYVTSQKVGRGRRYAVDRARRLRHGMLEDKTVSDLLGALDHISIEHDRAD